MPEKYDDQREQDPQIQDLPEDKIEQYADDVKGGVARRGGDDDLDDLEVERQK
jgi:hypothetical protein